MKTAISSIKSLPTTNIVVTAKIKKMANLLIETKGVACYLPILFQENYELGKSKYLIRSGNEVIEAAKYAASISKLNVLLVLVATSKEDEKLIDQMLEKFAPIPV